MEKKLQDHPEKGTDFSRQHTTAPVAPASHLR